MNLRDSVLIQRNAILPKDLKVLAQYLQSAPRVASLVSNFEDDVPDDAVEWVVNKQIRDTQEVELTSSVSAMTNGILDACVLTSINPFYRVEVLDREPLQVLHYGPEGHYIPHVDAETLFKDDIGLEMWEKTLDRDLSIVCFLNDDYAGGELVFPQIDLTIQPEAGTLVCFPSDHHYIHGVNAVTTGHRYTLVTWMRVKGVPTMDEINQARLDEYQRLWPQQVEQPPRLAKGGNVGRK